MDIETFIESILHLIKNSNNASIFIYALVTMLLSQILKLIFVNKVKVDIFHKFDLAVLFPFIFGSAFSVFDYFMFNRAEVFTMLVIYDIVIKALAIGALSSVMFKFVKTLFGNSLDKLLKDDVFGIFYTQLVYFSTVKDSLAAGELQLTDFIVEVKVVAQNAKGIYANSELRDEVKRSQLKELLKGIVECEMLDDTVNAIHNALLSKFNKMQ